MLRPTLRNTGLADIELQNDFQKSRGPKWAPCIEARIRVRVRGWPKTSKPCLRFHPVEWKAGQNSHEGKVPQYKPVSMEEKDDAVKDAFYANLEHLNDKFPAHDINIVLGDFNTKVGQEGIFGPTVG